MSKHLLRDLEHLKKDILSLGSAVEAATDKAIKALLDRREDLAQEVLKGDSEIDRDEMELEESCLKLLALHQPVATDLRFVIAVMKVTNDLERMGDLATNIAERATDLAEDSPIPIPASFSDMAGRVRGMQRDSLNALVNMDTKLARDVCRRDEEVDQIHAQMFEAMQKVMSDDPKTIRRAIHTLSASRHLERMADLATNIAEDVVFMVEGDIIRHHNLDE